MSRLGALQRAHPVVVRATVCLVGVVVALVVVGLAPPLTDYNLGLAGGGACVLIGLSFLTGMSGQVSLGHGALMGVGAYTAGIWAVHHPTTPIVANLALCTLAGAVAGLVVGIPATRLRGPYLAGMTIAIAVAFGAVLDEATSWTNGDQGLALPNPVSPPHWLVSYVGGSNPQRPEDIWLAAIAVVTTGVACFFMANLFSSRTGRAMRLVRENEVAAELAGVSLPRARVLAFVVSSACAGLGGGLTTLVQSNVRPGTFGLPLSIEFLTLLVIGGIGTISGAVLGGVFYAFVNSWISSLVNATGLNPTSNLATSLNGIIFGGLLIVFVLIAPLGLAGTTRVLIHRRLQARHEQTTDLAATK